MKLAAPDREVFVVVGDGAYLMMAQELVTAEQERVNLIVVLVQNHWYASIGRQSESVGAQRIGTAYRFRDGEGWLAGDTLPVDLAANARSLGAEVIRATSIDELTGALAAAREAEGVIVVHVDADPYQDSPGSGSWWDVPVAASSTLNTVRDAHARYQEGKRAQNHYL